MFFIEISSKKKYQIEDLEKAHKKYSEKVRKYISELIKYSPEEQVIISNSVEEFLNKCEDTFGLNKNFRQENDKFIGALRSYGDDSSRQYVQLWDTINELEAIETISSHQLALMIDEAIASFANRFGTKFNTDFARDISRPDIAQCIYADLFAMFNHDMDKLDEIQGKSTKKKSGNDEDGKS